MCVCVLVLVNLEENSVRTARVAVCAPCINVVSRDSQWENKSNRATHTHTLCDCYRCCCPRCRSRRRRCCRRPLVPIAPRITRFRDKAGSKPKCTNAVFGLLPCVVGVHETVSVRVCVCEFANENGNYRVCVCVCCVLAERLERPSSYNHPIPITIGFCEKKCVKNLTQLDNKMCVCVCSLFCGCTRSSECCCVCV